jgi:carbon-monoxide dehydrogenase small subunit
MILTACDLLKQNPKPTAAEIRRGLEGNLCRCTGYQNIVGAVLEAAGRMSGSPTASPEAAAARERPAAAGR